MGVNILFVRRTSCPSPLEAEFGTALRLWLGGPAVAYGSAVNERSVPSTNSLPNTLWRIDGELALGQLGDVAGRDGWDRWRIRGACEGAVSAWHQFDSGGWLKDWVDCVAREDCLIDEGGEGC